ncbi:cellulose biosynthesis protein BcsO [Erwinia sp. MMLR14_017]|uniref:cellulose biosynthesis protein BcsO n=1 Tax=Erwinia sp. MMLR14_017 TaxID=3093842 RepID=UPI0029904B1F|nr:cellulose biosynthesis protein BcsO [Erwinia sp. MMLR14_017]MDW8845103.1 cellulose biosynthesis protein BcsO [Erwinia sp. MMLR14_017]
MKSYDDLQRFKEKTQTNHIEFKDMSEQTKNSDGANWAIIKQLMNEGAEAALGNGQLTDIAAPQPITNDTFTAEHASSQALPTQPHSLRPQPVAQASAQPHSVAAFVAKPAAVQVGASLLESIAASLKPVPAEEPAPAEPATAAAEFLSTTNPLAAAQAFNPLAARLAQTVNTSAAAQPASPLAAAQPAQAVNPLAATQATGPAPASSLLASLAAAPSAPTTPFAAATPQPVATAQGAPVQPTAEQLPRFRQLFSAKPASVAISKDTLLQPLLERIASCR